MTHIASEQFLKIPSCNPAIKTFLLQYKCFITVEQLLSVSLISYRAPNKLLNYSLICYKLKIPQNQSLTGTAAASAGQKEKTTPQCFLRSWIALHFKVSLVIHCTAQIVLYCTLLNIIVQHCTKATSMLQCTALQYVLLKFPLVHCAP